MSDTETGTAHFELYRCTECGKLSVSLGWIHGHIEKHQGIGPFNLIPHPLKIGNPDALMQRTEVIQVTDYRTVDEPEMVES